METEYWTGRWERGETGWHKAEVNPYLVRHWASAGVPAGARVLVPLCGKSLDLGWLATQGHPVLGVELSPRAVAAFFAEAGLAGEAVTRRAGAFEITGARGIEIACGDIFALGTLAASGDLAEVAGLYDRAALIALPPALRLRYAETLGRHLGPSVRGLTITLEYDQALRAGPPFSVTPDEVRVLFGRRFDVAMLCDDDVLASNPGFVQAGIPALREHVFALREVMTSRE